MQVTAAIIALLNDARLRAGKPALGFLNPWLYSSGYKGFTDITAGQSDGCNGQNTQTGSGVNGVSLAMTLWRMTTTDTNFLNSLVLSRARIGMRRLGGIRLLGLERRISGS